MHESLDEFKFRPDTTSDSRVICPCTSEKLMYNVVNTLSPYILDLIFFSLSGNKDYLTAWTEFEFEADWTKGYGVSCP